MGRFERCLWDGESSCLCLLIIIQYGLFCRCCLDQFFGEFLECKLWVTWFCWDGRSTCQSCGFCFVWMCWRCWATNAVVQAIGQFGGRCEDSLLGAENCHSRLDCLTGRLRLWFSAGTRFFISRSVNYDKLYMINHSGTKKGACKQFTYSRYMTHMLYIYIYILVVDSPVWHLVGNICMKISRIPIWPAQQLLLSFTHLLRVVSHLEIQLSKHDFPTFHLQWTCLMKFFHPWLFYINTDSRDRTVSFWNWTRTNTRFCAEIFHFFWCLKVLATSSWYQWYIFGSDRLVPKDVEGEDRTTRRTKGIPSYEVGPGVLVEMVFFWEVVVFFLTKGL